MAIEVDHSNRSVRLVNTPQQRKGNCVVTTHGNDTGEGLASLRKTLLVCVGEGLAHEDAVVAFFNLLDSPGIVISMETC